MCKEVRLVLIGRQGRGKTTFSKAAVQKARGKEGGADADSDDELEAERQDTVAPADCDDEREAERQDTGASAATAAADGGDQSQPGRQGFWEQDANSSGAGVTFAWRFDNGNAGGLVPVRVIDTPGVGRKENVDQANLKATKAHLTNLGNIHGFVLVTNFKFHVLDADDLVSSCRETARHSEFHHLLFCSSSSSHIVEPRQESQH